MTDKYDDDDDDHRPPTYAEVGAALEYLLAEGKVRIVGYRNGEPVYEAVLPPISAGELGALAGTIRRRTQTVRAMLLSGADGWKFIAEITRPDEITGMTLPERLQDAAARINSRKKGRKP
jgi:hypothetical protein